MHRPVRSAPVLSPATMKQIVDTFTHQYQVDSPSSSDSPDSAYSSASPTLPDQPFGFDVEDEDVEVAHHDEDEYETLMAENDGWDTPAWGRWPEAIHGRPAWSPAPDSVTGSGSLISVSPRGSLSNHNSARASYGGKGKQPEGANRRDSDASLLGFDLAQQRRRSSTRSLGSSTRRRSSGLSNFSTVDPIEDARLRSIASMELLRRRFSEVVEVTVASDGEEEDVALARNAVSQWSPYTASSMDDDDSEIHTAPYFPTPQLHSAIPAVLSNFPLSSVAAPNTSAINDGDADASCASSPIYPTHRLPVFSQPPSQPTNGTSTPPTQPQPSMLLRERSRPACPRAATDYQFPARSTGVPPGAAAPRPIFSRSVSTPIYSSAPPHREPPIISEKRVAGPPIFSSNAFASGSFPLARAVPLGVSPLQESLRRQSVVSDGDSRRPSSIDPSDILAERRASLKESLVRRASMGARRSSGASSSPSRRESSGSLRRKSSLVPLEIRRLSGPDSRRSSLNDQRRTSLADRRRSSAGGSRKSSIVSISEYGYLGPQIVIDGPNAIPETSSAETSPGNTKRPQLPSIVLPAFTFPSANTPASTPYTPRFNPLDSFFGRATSPSIAPTTPASMICPLSPASSATHSAGAETERSIPSPTMTQTPKKGTGIMDRGRPISPPEYRDYSIPLSRLHHSPRSPESGPSSRPGSRESGKMVMITPLPSSASTPALSPPPSSIPAASPPSLSPEIAQLRPSVSRKAVPQMTSPDLRAELLHNEEMVNRRISTVLGAPALGMSLTEIRPRAIAINANAHRNSPARPSYRRQTTFPTELESKKFNRRSLNNLRSLPDPEVPGEVSGSTTADSQLAPRQASVTFADDLIKRRSLPAGLPAGIARPSMNRASSFSRLFQTKQRGQGGSTSHTTTTVKLVQRQSDPQRSSTESSSSSERSLVEMTAVFRKVSGSRSTDEA
ncbi:hypothetical protein EHS25_002422 [Saitozyma podzolica]|uniref:Uncharacterized protein n=1 Tax=Saitozyma podzolica TaxID=1890683 RepID=A0A427YDW0_9TREE|nr:hypothetical protein EHS25_002422 [Saitozyma podzolica]